jgi:hypothetical protein
VTFVRFSWVFILLPATLWLGGNSSAKEVPIFPTFARNVAVKVSRGGDVEITLQALPSFGHQITFHIQNSPLHGTLSKVHTISDHTASIVYHHDGSNAQLRDEFTFRAQAFGNAVSEQCRVVITVVPPPASLVFDPPALDFGKVMLSGKSQKTIAIRNRGGVLSVGHLILPRGYSAPLGDGYHLAEGESNTVVIEFDPMEEGEYSGQVTTRDSCERGPLELRGSGIARFDLQQISPVEWEIRNLSDMPIRISTAGGEGWTVPGETSISPHDSRRLFFQQAYESEVASKNISTNAVVHLSDGLSDREISLPPLRRFTPVALQAVTSSDLGKIPMGAAAQIAFTLINRSEYPKHLTWSLASPSGGGSDGPFYLDIKGGGSQEIQYDWKPSLPGDATITLTVSEGKSLKSIKSIGSTSHELVWKACVLPDTRTSSALNPGGSSSENQVAMVAQEPPSDESQAPDLTPAKVTSIPPVSGGNSVVRTSWMGPPSLLLSWDAGGLDPSCFKIAEEQLVLMEPFTPYKDFQGTFQLPKTKMVLNPFDVSMAKKEGDQLSLKLRGLSPGWHHLVLSQLNKDGSLEAQSQFHIRMQRQPSLWEQLKVPIGSVIIGLLIFYLFRLRRS